MHTHWNTMYCGSFSSTSNSMCFQVRGSNPSQVNFLWCGSNDKSYKSINQSIDKVIQKIFSIDWPWQKVGRRKKSQKLILTGVLNPRPGNVELELPQYTELQYMQHVSRSGVRIPVKAIYCGVAPMTTHINQSINQSIKLFKKYSPLIDRGRKLGEGKKRKNCHDWEFEPQTWKPWNLMWNCHSTRCSNGCSLGSLLFSCQGNHVQRCEWKKKAEKIWKKFWNEK